MWDGQQGQGGAAGAGRPQGPYGQQEPYGRPQDPYGRPQQGYDGGQAHPWDAARPQGAPYQPPAPDPRSGGYGRDPGYPQGQEPADPQHGHPHQTAYAQGQWQPAGGDTQTFPAYNAHNDPDGRDTAAGSGHRRRKPAKPPWRKWAAIGAAAVVVVGAAGFGAYTVLGDDGKTPAAKKTPKPVNTAPPTVKEVTAMGTRFLSAWAGGQAPAAAALTDDAVTAQAGLTAYTTDAAVTSVKLTPGVPAGTSLPYHVEAQVKYGEKTSPWTYDAKLEVKRDTKTGKAVVHWAPTVLHPKLGEGEKLRTGEPDAPPVKALDRNGKLLDTKTYPSMGPIIASLREKYGKKAGGSGDVEIWIEPAKTKKGEDHKAAAPETLLVLAKGRPGTVKTTIDARMQAEAERQVKKAGKSSLVAIRPSTGEILAVANYPGGGFDSALQGSLAPGSTMKVVTASMLLDKGLVTSTAEHPCPKYVTYGGWKFQNVEKFELPDGSTFAQSFANSCNTAFIGMAPKLDDDDLTKQARDVFGIGLNWQPGVTTFDGRVPVQSQAQMAAELIGQGGVRANPMVMASVSATVRTGVFKQPYLVSPRVDGRTLAKAPRTMKASTLTQLRGMMAETAIWGTAATAMKGLGGDVGAKTGTSEVDGQDKPNAWFTAYRGDVAAAAVVPETGHGGEFAGPLVRAMLAMG
ncbi:penicillin-binding transpeptidase domain-containing protein [Streptomyces sp. NPDC051940]|uniref:penicillin-binding transpeptidase domain-containing protein n=1 Tax=Streptomyces sp. NPDC051940 TaxID=3155675 RepID=UPI003419EFD8